MRSPLPLLILCAGLLSIAPAQESPFVSREMFRLLSGEISGDIAYDHVRHLTLYHSPNAGSRGFRDKNRWIAEKAHQVGLEEVRIIDDLKYRGVGWSALSAELWIVSPDNRRLASYDEAAVAIADHSGSGAWEGELIDVDTGVRDADYEGKDVKGKIVLTSGPPSVVARQAVYQRGALGIVYYNAARGIDHPDQVAWTSLSPNPPKDQPRTFAFSISYRTGIELKRRLAPRPAPSAVPGAFGEGMRPGENIVLRARVSSEFEENPNQWMVEGWIRGTQLHERAIVLTAHTQEEKFSANDDNSGCANLLEIARSVTSLIREGRLPRPVRDIRFWWTNEISSEYEYFAAHPEERARILVNLNQDMVGARQSLGSRIQHITRTPDSRPSYLNGVLESVALMVMRGNSAYLAAGQSGSQIPYSRPILSRFGTRDRYGLELIPFFTSSDHMVFNDSIIGVPATTFTNWPDEFIHSSDDDLWQIDPTQMQRNAFVVAAVAVYLAGLQPAGLPALAAQVHAGTRRTLSDAFARSTELLLLAEPAERVAAFRDGLNLTDQAAQRAAATLDSLRVFEPDRQLIARLEQWKNALAASGVSLRASLADHYRLLTGQSELPSLQLSEEEKRMASKVPEVAASVAEYLEKRNQVRVSGLPDLMRYEVWNFVDGRRSYLDIYRAARAEAQSAGAWYYGTVNAKAVEELLEAGVQAGILRLKK
jgi:hypothetical protein